MLLSIGKIQKSEKEAKYILTSLRILVNISLWRVCTGLDLVFKEGGCGEMVARVAEVCGPTTTRISWLGLVLLLGALIVVSVRLAQVVLRAGDGGALRGSRI